MSKNEFIKRIPDKFHDILNLKRFKISLIKCKNKSEVRKVRNYLDYKVISIFNNINDFNKEKAKDYLKTSIQSYLLELDNINISDLDKKIELNMNKTTLQSIINNSITQKTIEHKSKFKELEKSGIDISVKSKKSSTVMQYESILTLVDKFFKSDYDINNLNRTKTNEFRNFLISYEKVSIDGTIKSITNNTINLYVQQLSTIFKNYIINNDLNIMNPFSNFKALKVTKNKQMFTYSEIEESKKVLDDEEYFTFNTLLLNGMRYEEILTLKKKDIQYQSFVFVDSKHQFTKIVPIHKSVEDKIHSRLNKIDDNDYIFFPNMEKNRIANTRAKINEKLKSNFDKTLHKTRSTFITYLNNFNNGFNQNDIKSLTHMVQGMDNEAYVVTRNLNNLKKVIDSIELSKLNEIKVIK